jgi:hypothetical protein
MAALTAATGSLVAAVGVVGLAAIVIAVVVGITLRRDAAPAPLAAA